MQHRPGSGGRRAGPGRDRRDGSDGSEGAERGPGVNARRRRSGGTDGVMSIGSRVLIAAKAAASKALDRMADPRESLDHTYQRQAEQLTKLQRRVAEAAAAAP